MKNPVLILMLILPGLLLAQDTKSSNPNVELPDFVITGKEVVSVGQAKKIPPDFVSTLSQKFIRPAYSPEELELKEFPYPLKEKLNLFDSLNYNNGWLEAGLGSYYLPTAKLTFSSPFANGVFEGRLGALNQRAYVPNSDKYELNGGATLYYFIKSQLPAFDGMKLKLNGDLAASGYKLYGDTINPVAERVSSTGNFSFLINNLSGSNFIYEFELSDELATLDKPDFSENLFGFNGFMKANFSAFNIGLNLNYKRQFILNRLQNNSEFYFINVRPTAGIDLSDILRVQFGITYAKDGSNSFSAPYASAALHFDKNLSLFGEFAPDAEFLTENYFIRMNPYLNTGSFTNIFFEKTNVLKAVLKYEYGEYFEIDGGIKYYASDEIPVLAYNIMDGTFNVVTLGGTSVAGFVNMLFHLGPFGIFYGTAQLEDARDDANNVLPYHPKGTVSLNYGYNFKMGLNAGASLYYASEFYGAKTYADSISTETINSYIDIGLNFSYKITPGFFLTLQMNNLFNNENYKWLRYKELPLNIIGGIKITW
jgi:hypothetical protein